MDDGEARAKLGKEIDEMVEGGMLLWYASVSQLGGGDTVSFLLAKAVENLRDAARCAANPALRQTVCVQIGEVAHAMNGLGHILCGTQRDIHASWMPVTRVPTCENCIRLLSEKEGE